MNYLYHGDNLLVLREHVQSASVDLVYLDPPFFTGRSHYADREQQDISSPIAFRDCWRWDSEAADSLHRLTAGGGRFRATLGLMAAVTGKGRLLAYLLHLAERLEELHRVLRPGGALYLHVDPRVSHYLKLLMDGVFGVGGFRNEIIWHYGGRGAKAVSRQFGRNHDSILYYARAGEPVTFHRPVTDRLLPRADAKRKGIRQDGDGRWFKTAPRGDYTDESIQRLENEDRVHRTRSGRLRVKYFLAEQDGGVLEQSPIGDTWTDIPDAMHVGRARTGYPTEKPVRLLERIISVSSSPGDLVLDPYAGSGTTLVAAELLGRRWIGVDASPLAIEVIDKRRRATGRPSGYSVDAGTSSLS